MDDRFLGSAVVRSHEHEDVFRRGFRIFHEDVEVAVIGENAGVQQFEFELRPVAAAVFLEQSRVRKFRLRIFVEHFQVGMGRGSVQIVINLLHVLAVIALGIGEAEEALLEERVFAIPQRQRQAELLMVIAEAGQAILAPTVSAAAGVVMSEIPPCITIRTVVLAYGPPLALGKVRPPSVPMLLAGADLDQALLLGQKRAVWLVLLCVHYNFVILCPRRAGSLRSAAVPALSGAAPAWRSGAE